MYGGHRPHDLLWLERPDGFKADGELPGWLDTAWLSRAPLVVRRETTGVDYVPVGARGLQRNQRYRGFAEANAVSRCVSPVMLARSLRSDANRLLAGRCWPCVAALLLLAPQLDALDLEWGPTGGAGFWLATGLPVLRPTSDLDLLVRAPTRLAPAVVRVLSALQEAAPCRLDIQVETGAGGFALSEYSSGALRVLLKTAHGPLLLDDPWAHKEAG